MYKLVGAAFLVALVMTDTSYSVSAIGRLITKYCLEAPASWGRPVLIFLRIGGACDECPLLFS